MLLAAVAIAMPIEPDDLDIPPLPPPPVVHLPPGPTHSLPPLRSQLELVRTGSNARWGAIVAGVVVTCASWLVLHAFGVGVGMSAIGVWSMVTPILALFAGGLVVSRLAPTPNRFNRMLHGVLVWAVTAIVAALVFVTITESRARAAPAVTEPGPETTSVRGLGLEVRDLQLERAIDEAIQASVRVGRLHRETLVSALDENTALTAGDIDDIANEVEARWYRAAQRASEIAMHARKASLAAADATAKVLLGLSLALMLGLTAAVGGALATGHRDRRRVI